MSTLILDAFTGTTGTTLASHTIAPTNTPAASWTANQGTWQIQGNAAQMTATAGDNEDAATCDAGVADVTAQSTILMPVGYGDSGVIVNFVDNNNYWVVGIRTLNSPPVRLFERNGGTFTQRGSDTTTISNGTSYTLQLISAGDTISAKLNGTQVIAYTVASRPFKTATRVGLKTYGTDTGSTHDDFTVTSGAATSTAITEQNLPANHNGNITVHAVGTGTNYTSSTTWVLSGPMAANWSVASKTFVDATHYTIVLTPPAAATPPTGTTGTLTITEGVTGTTAGTTMIGTPTLSIAPTSGAIGTTPTLTLTPTNTLWLSETASTLMTKSGGTGASLATPTITGNTGGNVVLTAGSANATITITDTSTGATTTFNVQRVVAATYYVDPATGNDLNNGTAAGTPWLTMTKANAGPAGGYIAGDTLLFKGPITGNLAWTTSGTQAARCLVSSYGGGATISPGTGGDGVYVHNAEFVTVSNLTITGPGVSNLDGSTTSTGYGVHFHDDRTAGSKYRSTYVSGCTVSGCKSGIGWTTPMPDSSPASVVGYADLRVTGCTVHDCQVFGIATNGGATWSSSTFLIAKGRTTFLGLYVGSCTVYNLFGTASVGTGPLQVTNCTGAVVERNVVHDCGAWTTGTSGGVAGVSALESASALVQFNEVYHTFRNGTPDGCAIDFDGGALDCTAQYNYTHENDGAGLMCYDYGGSSSGNSGNAYRFNVSRNDCLKAGNAGCVWDHVGATFYRNTVIADQNLITGSTALVTTNANSAFTNNLLVARNGLAAVSVTGGSPSFVGNLYYAPGGTLNLNGSATLAAWQGAGYEASGGINYGVVGDPLLSAPTSGAGVGTLPGAQVNTLTYFDLGGGSPAIGAGVPPNLPGLDAGPCDFHEYPSRTGAPVDIGAVSYSALTLLPPTVGGPTNSTPRIVCG